MTAGASNLRISIGLCTLNAGRCNKRLIRWKNRAWSVDGLMAGIALAATAYAIAWFWKAAH